MRVLMLGWEFPPHISGGLGTACLGIVRGLASQGVDVVFVVPRAHGDEATSDARLIGAASVAVRGQRPADAGNPDDERWGAVGPPTPQRPWRMVAVPSALSPYASPRANAGQGLSAAPPRTHAPRPPTSAVDAPPLERRKRDARDVDAPTVDDARRAPSYLDVRGGYGADLFDEVDRYARAVEVIARRERCDVVHAHDWMTFPAGRAAARAAGAPLVVHVHACEYDRSGEHVDARILAIEAAGLEAADRVVCVSRYTAEQLAQRYGVPASKLRVVHNAVEPRSGARRRASPPRAGAHRPPLVLFLGRVTFQKGPEYFLEAAARVLRVAPQVRFVICGSGDLLPGIVERTARVGLARNVRFTGFLGRAEVERMYALADLYVMPSVSEPFGIAPLEAVSQDVPVIVSRQSGVAEVLHSALKVDFWDVEELANKILALLRRPALRRVLREDGRREVAQMRWESRGKLLREVYAEVAS